MRLWKSSFSGGSRRAYSPEDKPETRWELVKLIVTDHFFSLIPANLILLAVFIPALFWTASGLSYILYAMGPDGSLADFISLSRTWVTVMIPCLLFHGPFLAGMSVLMRNLARDDKHFPKEYFIAGFKESWKPALLISTVSSLIPLLIWAAFAFYMPRFSSAHFMLVPLILTVVLCLIWMMTLPTLYMMLGTYRQSVWEQIKNAVALTLSHLPLVTGVHLLTLSPILLTALIALVFGGKLFIAVLFVLCIYYLFFGFAFAQLLYAFLANKLCEETLNAQLGENTHIGMR